MRVRLHPLRMVDGIACSIHGGAVRHVSDRVGEEPARQGGAWRMQIWLDQLGVVDGIPSSIDGSSIWQVAHIIHVLRIREDVLLMAVGQLGAGVGSAFAWWLRDGRGKSGWARRRRRGQSRRCWRRCGRPFFQGVVAHCTQGSAIHQVAQICSIH